MRGVAQIASQGPRGGLDKSAILRYNARMQPGKIAAMIVISACAVACITAFGCAPLRSREICAPFPGTTTSHCFLSYCRDDAGRYVKCPEVGR
mgnify:CR=1 FL=1